MINPADFDITPPERCEPVARIVDDEAPVRESLSFNLRIAGIRTRVFESAEDFLENDDNRHPGCVVLDIRMPGMSGLELQDEMIRRSMDLPILFLTGHGDIGMAVSALKKGAGDFLEKLGDPAAIRERVAKLMEQNVAARRDRFVRGMLRERFERLTDREKEVIRRVAADQLNKVIAIDLDIQEHTVKIHRANACRKLGVRSALEVHRFLAAIGEIDE